LVVHRDVAVPDLRRLPDLARQLDWRLADILAIAGLAIPADLMPADPAAKQQVCRVLTRASRLTADEIELVRAYAQALPPAPEQRWPAPPPLTSVTFGAVLERFMLIRNLSVSSVCRVVGWAEVLLHRLIRGFYQPKPVWLLYLGDVLGLRPDDLAALCGVPAPSGDEPNPDYRSHIGGLVWDLTPLSAAAVQQVARFIDMRPV
jgi:hypothetical protein